jgi:hypothetical protein
MTFASPHSFKSGPSKGGEVFFLFEENPFWYTTAYEVLMEKSSSDSLTVVIYGNSMPKLMDGTANFIKKNQGGFLRNYNVFKFLIRRLLPIVFKNTRPSQVIIRALAKTSIEVIDLSGTKRKIQNYSRMIMSSLSGKVCDKNKWLKVVEILLGEIHSTEKIDDYLSRRQIQKYVQSAQFMEERIRKVIGALTPTTVCYLNGRTLYERILLEVCRDLGIKSLAYETNVNLDKYQVYEGSITNIEFQTDAIQALWKSRLELDGLELVRSRGAIFFEDRFTKIAANPFLNQMNADLRFVKKPSSTVYSFFTSSSEEMNSIYSLYGRTPPDQQEIILKLIDLFEADVSGLKELVIRVHPNLGSKRKADREFYKNLSDSENVKIYPFDSGINSYELLKASDYVITTVSTVGLEAAYLGKPSYCFGMTFWSGLEVSKTIQNVNELFQIEPIERSKAHEEALKFGLFSLDYGSSYRHVDMKKLSDVKGVYFFDPLRWFLRRLNMENLSFIANAKDKKVNL